MFAIERVNYENTHECLHLLNNGNWLISIMVQRASHSRRYILSQGKSGHRQFKTFQCSQSKDESWLPRQLVFISSRLRVQRQICCFYSFVSTFRFIILIGFNPRGLKKSLVKATHWPFMSFSATTAKLDPFKGFWERNPTFFFSSKYF